MRRVEAARLSRVEGARRQGEVLPAADVGGRDTECGELRQGERLEDRAGGLGDEALVKSGGGVGADGVREGAREEIERQSHRAVGGGRGAVVEEREQRIGEAVRDPLAVERNERAVV